MPKRIPFFKPAAPGLKAHRNAKLRERDAFYGTSRWRKLRAAYLIANPLCARHLERDELVPASVVHHKVERLDRPDLALDWDNLEGLCPACHTRGHKGKAGQEDG